MPNPIVEVATPTNYDDYDKLDSILALVEQAETPIFVHLHWMGTHGPKFVPREQVFSAGKDQVAQARWDTDFYDDGILDFDRSFEAFYQELSRLGVAENSLFIFVSDHGQRWTTNQRLPIILRFPNGEFSGTLSNNVQNLDIAPTILDYLDIPIPQWMEGASLLGEIPVNRPIYSVGVGEIKLEDGEVATYAVEPPFYQFGYASRVVCDRVYTLNLVRLSLATESIEDYMGECPSPLNQAQALQLFIDFFNSYGYDTSSLANLKE
jgi:hypothetical protein